MGSCRGVPGSSRALILSQSVSSHGITRFPAPFPWALRPRDGGAGEWRVATGGDRVAQAGGMRWLMQSRGADAVEPVLCRAVPCRVLLRVPWLWIP